MRPAQALSEGEPAEAVSEREAEADKIYSRIYFKCTIIYMS